MPTKPIIDKARAIKQRTEKGMSFQEIADNQGVSKQAVAQLLSRVTNNDLISAFTSKRADVYTLVEHDILNSIDDADIKKASLLQKVTAAGILKTHHNLETGKATSISEVDIRALVASIEPKWREAQPSVEVGVDNSRDNTQDGDNNVDPPLSQNVPP